MRRIQTGKTGRSIARVLNALVVLGVLATMLPAYADVVRTNVVAGGSDTIALPASGSGSTTISYHIDNDKAGGFNGCDATGKSPAKVTVIVPAGVTKSPPDRLEFKDCGDTVAQAVTLSSATPGNYSISVSVDDDSGAYDTSKATFILKVVRRNTAPTLSISGVVHGASYEKGSVPVAFCNVDDKEDGAKTFPATLSAISGGLSNYGLGNQTASCSYKDAGGLEGFASAVYSIVDSTAPTLTLPGDITADATGPSGAPVAYTASASDAVDSAPSWNCSPASDSTFPLGPTIVHCSATDVAGNRAVGQFNVMVQDTTSPILALPSNRVAEATGSQGAAVTWTASANDSVDGALTPTCAPSSGSTFVLGDTPVNCSASDKAGNRADGGFNVSVQDTTPPTLTLPADVDTEAEGPETAVVYSANAFDLVSGDRDVVCDYPSGSSFAVGDTTVSCSAIDAKGNRANNSFKVTVKDTTAPALTLPLDITEEATKTAGADITFAASASDLVDGNVPVECTPTSGGTFEIATTTVNCSASDNTGNNASGSFKITVSDTTPPLLTDLPGDQVIEATGPGGARASYTPPSALDIVDGSRPVVCSPASGSTFSLGHNIVTCSTGDLRGNAAEMSFTVEVVDTTPPEVSVPDNIEAEATSADGANVSWSGVSALDVVDGLLPANCDAKAGDTFPLGTTKVTCSSQDAAGNEGTNAFTISVQDETAPHVIVPADQILEATGPDGAKATWTGTSATDVVDGAVTVSCDRSSGDTFVLGDNMVTCSARDAAGNTGYSAFVIKVVDTTAPEVTVPADFAVEAAGPDGAAASYSASAVDLVEGAIEVSCTPASGNTFHIGDSAVTCSAVDRAGNEAASSFTITVIDTTAPAIVVPADQKIEATSADGARVNYSASANDLVDGDVIPACLPGSGSTFPLGTTEVTCRASDSKGNEASKSFKVTVVDTTAPAVNVPGSLAAMATSASGATVFYSATASDLVDGDIIPTCSPASGTTFAPGETIVSCSATDKAGNTGAGRSFKVRVSFDFIGFSAPVDRSSLNGMKAGSTAPMKWQVSNQKDGYISDLAIVKTTLSAVVSCTGGASDPLDEYATGGTSLRYDSSANQFVYNWQSPKQAGKCYRVTITLSDGNPYPVAFQLK
ncbi:MAG: HYR domain-containing protein [Nitriliruptorales bacterium]